MKIPSLTLLSLDQVPDATQADKALVSQLNSTQSTLYSALQGRLTLADNITSQQQTIQFTSSATYSSANTFTTLQFNRSIPYRMTNLILTQIINTNTPYAPIINPIVLTSWQDVNGVINIYFLSGLLNSTPYQLTVLGF